jgi:hypothetical protein
VSFPTFTTFTDSDEKNTFINSKARKQRSEWKVEAIERNTLSFVALTTVYGKGFESSSVAVKL